MSTDTDTDTDTQQQVSDPVREAARKRIAARRDLVTHAVVYVVFNGLVVVAWVFTGRGYFWPAWLMAIWGVGLLMQLWDVLWRRPITEADIDAELGRRH